MLVRLLFHLGCCISELLELSQVPGPALSPEQVLSGLRPAGRGGSTEGIRGAGHAPSTTG